MEYPPLVFFYDILHEYCSVQETLVMILFVELAAVLDFNVTLQIYLTGVLPRK